MKVSLIITIIFLSAIVVDSDLAVGQRVLKRQGVKRTRPRFNQWQNSSSRRTNSNSSTNSSSSTNSTSETESNSTVEVTLVEDDMNNIVESLAKCASCHNAANPKFTDHAPDSSESCQTKKTYLKSLNNIHNDLIDPGSKCNSLLYQVLSDSTCSNNNMDERVNDMNPNTWNNLDSQNIQKLIEGYASLDSSCDTETSSILNDEDSSSNTSTEDSSTLAIIDFNSNENSVPEFLYTYNNDGIIESGEIYLFHGESCDSDLNKNVGKISITDSSQQSISLNMQKFSISSSSLQAFSALHVNSNGTIGPCSNVVRLDLTPPEAPSIYFKTTTDILDQPIIGFSKESNTKLFLIKTDIGKGCDIREIKNNLFTTQVPQQDDSVEIKGYVETLTKCAVCHTNLNYPYFTENIPDHNTSNCTDNKDYLLSLDKDYQLIEPETPCDSRIFTVLEGSFQNVTDCSNYQEVQGQGWMSGKANQWGGSDTDSVKNLISRLEKLNCPSSSSGTLVVDLDTTGSIDLNTNSEFSSEKMQSKSRATYYAIAVDNAKNISSCSEGIHYNNITEIEAPVLSIISDDDPTAFFDDGVYITQKNKLNISIDKIENNLMTTIYKLDENTNTSTPIITTKKPLISLDGIELNFRYGETIKLSATIGLSNGVISPPSNTIKISYRYQDFGENSNLDESILRYYKCHRLIHRAPPTHSDLYGVNGIKEKLDKIASLDEKREFIATECLSQLNIAELTLQGNNHYQIHDIQNEVQQRILKNINDFHTSLLKSTNPYASFSNLGAIDNHENAEAALRMTRALLTNSPWKSILDGGAPVEGIRSYGEFLPTGFTFHGSPLFDLKTKEINGKYYRESKILNRNYDLFIDGNRIKLGSGNNSDSGDLPWVPNVNISSWLKGGELHFIPNFTFEDTFAQISSDYYDPLLKDTDDCAPGGQNFYLQRGTLIGIKEASPCYISNAGNETLNIKNHAGGGAIGSTAYFLNNANGLEVGGEGQSMVHLESGTFHRRWARHVFEDFMCRSLPIFYTSETGDYVADSKDIYPLHTFRGDAACMNCHMSIDYAAAVARNWHTDVAGGSGVVDAMKISDDRLQRTIIDNFASTTAFLSYTEPSVTDSPILAGQIYPSNDQSCRPIDSENNQISCDIDSYNNCVATTTIRNEYDNSNNEYCSETCVKVNNLDVKCEATTEAEQYKQCKPFIENTDGQRTYYNCTMTNEICAEFISEINKYVHFCEVIDGSDGSTCGVLQEFSSKFNISDATYGCDTENRTRNNLINCEAYQDTITTTVEDKSTSNNACEHYTLDEEIFSENFNKLPPTGKLLTKDVFGNIIDLDVEGVDGLAKAITETIDFYACGVRNYFHFLTGDKIDLFYADQSEIENDILSLTTRQREKQQYIINLGQLLKDGNISTMQDVWKEIIKSDYFMESILGTTIEDEEISYESANVGSVDYYLTPLTKCVGCHKNIAPTFASNYDPNGDCESKKSFLQSLKDYDLGNNKIAIRSEDPCESRIYTVLEGSFENDGECSNYHPVIIKNEEGTDSISAWMSNYASNWGDEQTEIIKNLIENIDNLECQD